MHRWLQRFVGGGNKARWRGAATAQLPRQSEIILYSVGAFLQLGTNHKRRLDPKDRIAFQKLVALEEQMSDQGTIALIMK
jgi:hypothetical protein